MNIDDLPDDSESSDEDYVPEAANADLPSEEESDGDDEEALPPAEQLDHHGSNRRKKTGRPRKKLKGARAEEEEKAPKKTGSDEDKNQTDSLWMDFIKDTGFKTRAERLQVSTRPQKSETINTVQTKETTVNKEQTPKTIKVTEVYKFAGEEVKIEKDVVADPSGTKVTGDASHSNTSSRKASGGRLNSILNNLGKKRKINTLEKSKLDWEKFKKEENISDELQAYSKSKDGYLERQDFLQRADLRRFEIEKEIRTTLRNNRMNNINM